MKVEKKVIGNLTKCYSIAPLHYNNQEHFLVAAEKIDKCLLFDLDGNLEDTVWTEPGGVMTMVQIPNTNGEFLATHQFYSPNDSAMAKIVAVRPIEKGKWEVKTLVDLPHVHRFDILQRNGVSYLIACTLKSGHQYKDDWSAPGKVYGAVLPEDLRGFHEGSQLKLEVIKDDMSKNHGYYKVIENGLDTSIISSEQGVYQFIPPEKQGEQWEIKQLLDTPASDAVLLDMDEDGEMELAVFSPFHGDTISIYKQQNGKFEKIYQYEKPAPFLHAIFGGMICQKPTLVVGHRQGERSLLAFTWNQDKNDYEVQVLDQDCGAANVYKYSKDGKDILIAANHGINEIAMYTLEV